MHDAAIVGFAETRIETRAGRDVWELGGEILESLLDRTGIEKGEIDGMLINASMTGAGNCFWSQTTADYLGLQLDFCQTVDLGGSSASGAVARAAAALDAGLCTTVFLLNADTEASEPNLNIRAYPVEWSMPYGVIGPPADFGLLSSRYDHLYGLDLNALAKLAVTQRNHALMNDNACEKLRKPITVEDYMNSRMIAEPIRLLDCVMVCDGANGLLMTTRKRAKEKGFDKFAVPLGYGKRTHHNISESLADVTESGHAAAGRRAFAQAGLRPKDIGSFHPYDDFLIAILLQMEMLGFAPRGQGSAFINETNLSHDGDLPLNTGGGQISAGQAGLAGGGTNLIEAVRQLFGEGGARQVANRSTALVTGIGYIPYGRNWGTSVAMILSMDG
ncbi:thiolase family protein [Rhizorhapis sp.]|uniref:thiolase family protein n=1 Tax=Rhizorhapis sp. TaxID=1968842 RepID=UPI002B468A3F|nr:thiolase family protein [Rhizorhapis sp.]HKR17615.1 thiolase family protein [Rhizorhapis sp.]